MKQKLQIFLSSLQRFKKDKIHSLHNFGYFDYKYVVQESLENDPFSTYCLIWPNSIREINGKENYKVLILDTFRSENQKNKNKNYTEFTLFHFVNNLLRHFFSLLF